MQVTRDYLDTVLAGLIATGGVLDPAATWLGVGTAITQKGIATLMSDITEATGAMATRKSITAWGTPYILTDGRSVVDGPLMTWKPANAGEAQTLACWFLASALTAGNLLAYGLINPPINLPSELAHWSIVLRVTVDPQGRWSAEITYNG